MKKVLSTQAKEPIRLRTKKLANGNLSLYLDFYRDGKRGYEFLKLYLVPEKTKADKILNEETLRTANAIKAQKIVSLQNEEYGFTASNKSKVKFIDFMVVQAENYEERGSYAYAQSIRNSIYHLRKYKGDAVTLRQVDKAYLLGYIDFLNTTGGKYNKPLSDAAKALYFDVVVIALNKAVKDEIIPTNPAHKINYKDRPQQGEATKQYLTFEEVKSLVATPCKYEVLKQAFLFACFCGLRYSDIKGLEWGKIQKIKSGEMQVEIKQQKTGEPLYLPLSANALQWLPERGTAKDNDKVFPLPHVSTVEKFLPIWAKDAGINKHITFHVSRHTNATLMLSFGADIYTVSKLLGHTNVKTTQIYAKIVDENKRKAVNLIPEI
ncbi:site-specific integrase [uncultured Phocaeicola sp.]|uniref:site-specific integrase n=1 Tax=uncultured Phocaeicola sp. TaxID=990718 RepID=UPI0025DB000E|nr:site-specific integrase [uncultured Phocaeicola sp.]